mgnify:CR=1 FL=1
MNAQASALDSTTSMLCPPAPPIRPVVAPAADEFQHPLLHLFRPSIATRPIELLADAINAAIDAGYRGIGVYGFARFGKTEAQCYLCNHTEWMGQRLGALLMLDAPETHKRTDSTFFQSLLTLFGVRIPARSNPDQLCALLMNFLIERALNEQTHLIVIFIDEAQRLLPTDYENLVTLDNRMKKAGFYFFAVFVHQRDITGFTNEVAASDEYPPHVAGRFLLRKHEFTGLRDEADVAYALARYDEFSEWPPGSGISYTEHFAPNAFREFNFRLSHYAESMWRLASNLRSKERLPPDWTWPMKSFEAAVVHLLTVAIPRLGASFERLSDDDILEALWNAQLVELEKSRSTYRSQGGTQ